MEKSIFKNYENLPAEQKNIIERLKEGNERFINNQRMEQDFKSRRKELLEGQSPEVVLLTCSDSRIVPHYIFDQIIGELFMIREAGNILDKTSMGSIEYAASVLKSKLLLILGHDRCGAVTAAYEGAGGSEYINRIINYINPAIENVKDQHGKRTTVDHIIIENIILQMQRAYEMSDTLQQLISAGNFAIAGGLYDMASGEVRFMGKVIY